MLRKSLCASLLGMAAILASCGGDDDGGGNPGAIQFTLGTFTVNEDGTPVAAITVRRSGGADGVVGATITLAGGTATAGVPPLAPPADYDGTPIPVVFGDGDAADKVVAVPILNDAAIDPAETVMLALGAPLGGVALGAQITAVLVIADDDFPGTLGFSAPAFAYDEGGAPVSAQVTVTRNGGTTGAVSVTVTSMDGSANSDPASTVEPVDYMPVATVVNFADGDAAPKTVTLSIDPDLLPEVDETFTLALSAATGQASLGAQASATVTIRDDDVMLSLFSTSTASNEQFGSNVVNAAGRIAVSSPTHQIPGFAAGVVTLFGSHGTVLARLGNPTSNHANFGKGLAASGTDLVVGVPVGTPADCRAVVFDVPTGSVRYTLVAPAGAANFGSTLAATPAAVSVYGLPGVYTFDRSTGSLVSVPAACVDPAAFNPGRMVARGDRVLWGSQDFSVPATWSGRLCVSDAATGNSLLMVANPTPSVNDQFGYAVGAMDGFLVASAPGDDTAGINTGAVYLFDDLTGALVRTILPPAPQTNGFFGTQLTTVRDRIAVQWPSPGGASTGRVLIYDTSGTLIQTIVNPAPLPGAQFGGALAEFDGALLVGAPNQDVGGLANAGGAWVFKVD